MTVFLEKFLENKWRMYFVLLGVPFALYLKSLFYVFSPLDEQWLIVNNGAFLGDWSGLLLAFKNAIMHLYYRPVFTWSLITDYHLGKENPLIYHLSNLVFHLISVTLLYKLLLKLEVTNVKAFLLSLLFSVHPVLLHAVVWIPGRNDVLLGIFVLASLIQLVKYNRSGKMIHLLFQLLFFVLALLTKETAVVLPAIFIFLLFINKRFNYRALVLPVIWLIICGAWLWLRSQVINTFPFYSQDYLLSFKRFFVSFFIATGKSILPVSQSVTPTIKNSLPLAYIAITLLFLVVAYKTGVENKKIAFLGLFVFCILLVIPVWYGVLSPLGEQFEHRAYTPLIGLVIFAGQLKMNLDSKKVHLTLLSLFAFFVIRSFIRMDVYKYTLSYLVEEVNDCPDNYFFQTQISNYYYARKDYESALPHINMAVERQPGKAHLYFSRANIYMELNKEKEAIADYTKAVSLKNDNPEWILARCMAYKKFNDIKNAVKDLHYLKKYYPKVVPQVLELEINVAWITKQFSDLDAYILEHPDNAAAYVNRAKLFFDQRMGAQALADLKKACELEPENKVYKGYYEKLNETFPH